jgi:hypothetical protein
MDDYAKRVKERADWLESLKPGDAVAIPERWSGGARIEQVERVTATQIVLPHDRRFRKKTGNLITSAHWNYESIHPVTQEFLDANELRGLLHWIERVHEGRRGLSASVLRAMKSAYETETAKEAA